MSAAATYSEFQEIAPHSWQAIDAPPPPTAEQLAAREIRAAAEAERKEAERKVRRQHIREQLARSQLAEQAHVEKQREIIAGNQQLDQYAIDHETKCRPIQEELAEIEKRQIVAIIGREVKDAALESRRLVLLGQISEANKELETSLAGQKKFIERLERERVAIAKRIDEPNLITELYQTARPDLAMRLRISQSSCQWANARVADAQDKLVSGPRNIYFQALLTAAEAEVARLAREQAELSRLILEE